MRYVQGRALITEGLPDGWEIHQDEDRNDRSKPFDLCCILTGATVSRPVMCQRVGLTAT